MAEAMARFMGPEIQINALAPGPVDGIRLRGTGERPGLFKRRARLILENKRLNDVHAALIESQRTSDRSVSEFFPVLMSNDVEKLHEDESLPAPLQRLLASILEKSDPEATSRAYLLNEGIAQKLVQRLENGGYIPTERAQDFVLAATPPDPFFTNGQIEREARKVRDGVVGMLYLQRMPTEFDVAIATVYYLADRNTTGETFHPSGGLRFERSVTQGELFGKASPNAIARLRGTTVYLIGEHLSRYLRALTRTYLGECDVQRVVILTRTAEAAQEMETAFADHHRSGRFHAMATDGNIESALDRAYVEFGRPGPVVCTPFEPLPQLGLVASENDDDSSVMNAADFAKLVEDQITHHFRVSRKISLVDGAQLVLVTPATSSRSTAEEFALANFIKTTMHAFTATLGVESERLAHNVAVNQIDLTRRARNEEPRDTGEESEELTRFVNAVLLTSSPQVEAKESRYRSRIYRGNAITV
jgi:malonyl-CoA reductase/3-hydroxypropionate dehydrogenase (NADP+)